MGGVSIISILKKGNVYSIKINRKINFFKNLSKNIASSLKKNFNLLNLIYKCLKITIIHKSI